MVVAVILLLSTRQSGTAEIALEPGDILFMSNPCAPWYSQTSPWVHISIYVGNGKVVEAVSEGVRTYEAATWGGGQKTSVKRMRDDVPDRNAVIGRAVQYSLQQIDKPFDNLLNKNEDSRQYCSELMWHAYKQSDIDLNSRESWLVMPTDIYNSSHLVPVE